MSAIDFIVDLAELQGYGDSAKEKRAWRRCPHWERVEILRYVFRSDLVRELCKREEIFSHVLSDREELDEVLVRIAADRLRELPPTLIPFVFLAHDGKHLSIEYLKEEGERVFEFLADDGEKYLQAHWHEWDDILTQYREKMLA